MNAIERLKSSASPYFTPRNCQRSLLVFSVIASIIATIPSLRLIGSTTTRSIAVLSTSSQVRETYDYKDKTLLAGKVTKAAIAALGLAASIAALPVVAAASIIGNLAHGTFFSIREAYIGNGMAFLSHFSYLVVDAFVLTAMLTGSWPYLTVAASISILAFAALGIHALVKKDDYLEAACYFTLSTLGIASACMVSKISQSSYLKRGEVKEIVYTYNPSKTAPYLWNGQNYEPAYKYKTFDVNGNIVFEGTWDTPINETIAYNERPTKFYWFDRNDVPINNSAFPIAVSYNYPYTEVPEMVINTPLPASQFHLATFNGDAVAPDLKPSYYISRPKKKLRKALLLHLNGVKKTTAAEMERVTIKRHGQEWKFPKQLLFTLSKYFESIFQDHDLKGTVDLDRVPSAGIESITAGHLNQILMILEDPYSWSVDDRYLLTPSFLAFLTLHFDRIPFLRSMDEEDLIEICRNDSSIQAHELLKQKSFMVRGYFDYRGVRYPAT